MQRRRDDISISACGGVGYCSPIDRYLVDAARREPQVDGQRGTQRSGDFERADEEHDRQRELPNEERVDAAPPPARSLDQACLPKPGRHVDA